MDNSKGLVLLFFLLGIIYSAVGVGFVGKDVLRKSIVFNKKTPGVFYCPQHEMKGEEKVIVKAIPLKKLCEYDGKRPFPLPHKPDCYLDVDETDFGCKEKYRIMMRMHPPGSDKTGDKWQKAYNKFIKRKPTVRKPMTRKQH